MKQVASIQQEVAMDQAKQDLKAQLAEYVAQQPESTRAIHRLMSFLTAASVAVPVGFFIRALYLSIMWKSIDPIQIPVWWLAFVASGTLPILVFGLHAVILRAFPPIILQEKMSQFVTGGKAVASGLGLMLAAAAVAAFWGLFAYSVWTRNLALLEPLIRILAVAVSVAASIHFLSTLFRQISKSQ